MNPASQTVAPEIDLHVKVNYFEGFIRDTGVNKYYTITELTREFGVSTRTLRFYEDEGLIHPSAVGGPGCFGPQTGA